MIEHVERMVDEQRAGRRFRPSLLDPLSWELLLHWHACERAHEVAHRSRLSALFDLVLAMQR